MIHIVRAGGRRLLLVAGLAALAMALAPHAVLAQDATVAISPADKGVACNENTTVSVMINNVEDLFGVDFKISYDPNVVDVVDADGGNPGTQIQQGTFPDVSGGQGLVQVNSVDVGTGTISYAATLINPSPAQDGSGPAAQITFTGKANGTTDVELVAVLLSDNLARPIQAVPIDGKITVSGCDGGGRATATSQTPSTPPTPATPATPIPGDDDDDDDDDDDKECAHIVTRGENLYGIATRYGVTATALAARNNIKNPNWIYVGQKLYIPGCVGGRPGGPARPGDGPDRPGGNPGGGECFGYSIQNGDHLFGIALRYGDTAYNLALRNAIVNPNLIYVGQRIEVCGDGKAPAPGPGPAPKPVPGGKCKFTHYVKPGENLFRIAINYGTSYNTLATVNNLVSAELIYVGQGLCIP